MTRVQRRKWAQEPVVIFVEGYTDLIFYAELLEYVGLSRSQYFIQDAGGKERNQLAKDVTLLLRPDNLKEMKAVAILLDADESGEASFSGAQSALRQAAGVELKNAGEWTQLTGSSTHLGIFIVSGPEGKGEIETLAWEAWKSASENSTLAYCVDAFIQCARDGGQGLRSIDKVRVGAMLAVRNEDDPRLGPGARAKLFQFDSPHFKPLVDFFSYLPKLLQG